MNDSIIFFRTINPFYKNSFDSVIGNHLDPSILPRIEVSQTSPISNASADDTLSLILEKLDRILKYGIGFDDWTGYIAIPLIIALFAFSFPFIFNEVNRINNKYGSYLLTECFKNSYVYKAFFIFNKICISSLFLYGLIALILEDRVREDFLYWGNWVLFGLTLIYSMSILNFVSLCIQFNNPFQLTELLISQSKRKSNVIKLRLKIYKLRKDISLLICKDRKLRKKLSNQAVGIIKTVSNSAIEEEVRKNLTALVNHAIYITDLSLFYHTFSISMTKMRELDRKKPSYLNYNSFTFLESVFKYFSGYPTLSKVSETLICSLFSLYNKSKLTDEGNLVKTLSCISYFSRKQLTDPILFYLEQLNYRYSFIQYYPNTIYIEGKSPEEVTEARKQSIDNFEMVRNFQYILMGNFYHNGNFAVLDFLKNPDIKINSVLPMNGMEVLYRYVNCKDQIDNGGKCFKVYDSKLLFHEEINLRELIAKLTILLLFLTSNTRSSRFINLTIQMIRKMEAEKFHLKKTFKEMCKNPMLIHYYPGFLECDFDNLFNRTIVNTCFILRGMDPYESYYKHMEVEYKLSNKVIRKILIQNSISKREEDRLKESLSQYLSSINQTIRDELRHYYNINQAENINNITVPISSLSFLISKKIIIDQRIMYRTLARVNMNILDKLRSRILYNTLQIIHRFKIKTKYVTIEKLNSYLSTKVKDHPDNYVLIDISSPVRSLMLGIEIPNKQIVPMEQISTLKVENWVEMRYIEDLPEFKYFKESLVLIEKKYFPEILIACGDTEINFVDEPQKYLLKVEINPKIKIHYRETGNIIVIKIAKSKV